MQEGTARTIHALIYSGVVFGIGVYIYRSGKEGRGLAWQPVGWAAILAFTLFAVFSLNWIDKLISATLLLLESVLLYQFWRQRQQGG
jgi:RHS repeat-associated protein